MTDTNTQAIQGAITIDSARLKRTLEWLAKTTEKRNTVPILGMTRIQSVKGYCTMTATDLDQYAIVEVPCHAPESGVMFIETAKLLTLAKQAVAGKHEFCSLDWPVDGKAMFRAGDMALHIDALSHDADGDWPNPSPMSDKAPAPLQIAMPRAELAHTLDLVSPAISTEQGRYYLNGIYMHTEGHELRFAATDGHRLSLVKLPHNPEPDAGQDDCQGGIMPRKAIATMRAALKLDVGDDTKLTIYPSRYIFRAGRYTIIGKMIDGTFPDYRRVIPCKTGMNGTLRVAGSQLLDHCKLVQATGGRKATIALELSESGCMAGKQGEGAYGRAMYADYSGDEYNPCFNAAYLSDFAKLADLLELSAHDRDCPALIESPDLPQWTGVLMPIRGTGQALPRIAPRAAPAPEPIQNAPEPDSAADTPPIRGTEPEADSPLSIGGIEPEPVADSAAEPGPESADIIPLPVDPRARALRHERAAIDSERDARAHAKRLRLIRAYLAMRKVRTSRNGLLDEVFYWKGEAKRHKLNGEASHNETAKMERQRDEARAALASQPADDGAAHKANAERLERLLYESGQREGDLKRANAQHIAERDDARRVLADTIRRTDSERADMQGAIARGVAGIEALAEQLAAIERQPMHRAA